MAPCLLGNLPFLIGSSATGFKSENPSNAIEGPRADGKKLNANE
jgi:hypothetical protein